MATEIQMWEVKDEKLLPLDISMVEAGRKETTDLEKWIKSDSKILGDDLLIIGEQIETKKGPLDFLAIDGSGNLIIIELKRDKLPREALAQAIDYASDVASWDIDKIKQECQKYTGQPLEKYLEDNFKETEWEEISINEFQKILLVGTEVEESLERMIEWLSDNYNMGINVVILKYTQTKNGVEILARTTIISEEEEQEKSQRYQRKIYNGRYVLRKEFWTQLLEKANKKTQLHSGISPNIYSWIGAGAGKAGISYNYVIGKNLGDVEIYLDKGKDYVDPNINKKRFDELFKYREEIESKFGDKFDWERLDEKRASRIAFRIRDKGGFRNKEKWDELQNKMIDAMIRLEIALKDYIKKLD